MAGVTRFFHRLWVIVAAVRDCPGVVFEVCGATRVIGVGVKGGATFTAGETGLADSQAAAASRGA